MEFINGGVLAAKGFKASGVHCGIRKNKDKKDIALIYSETKCSAAATYTKNLVKGAPLVVTKNHIADGYAQAIICNSGNANTCNVNGMDIANETCKLLADQLNIKEDDIVIASTGVIGQEMDIEPFKRGIPMLISELNNGTSQDANLAIMTTDTVEKTVAVKFDVNGVECHIGGIAKGSGMINPNMATMLVFVTTDCKISPKLLQKVLSEDILDTFNMVSVDGDTSTNDMVTVLANGLAGNKEIDEATLPIFKEALNMATKTLCKKIAADGEGATRSLTCCLSGAKTKDQARKIAKSVISSNLLKCAIFGSDANWGRVLCAIGYTLEDIDVLKIDVAFRSAKGVIPVCKNGLGVPFSEEKAKEVLLEKDIFIDVNLNSGNYDAEAFGCDLTYEYVKINGDYRS
ncbi:MAG: bifunctional glutamate N-acetyltransferase/amino-acid acetyltransferase ArgJ [Acholeplasmatales bacterium]|nr:bifunctional glutamate N-acetyltransferase/amino-acid acetyltransferase ArgJ [Acholeplasmatales bacterium]